MPTSDELWAMGFMTYDQYEAEEGRPPPDDEQTEEIAANLNEPKGANDARAHS
jgi:hypothetical protein